ncbi:MAG: acetyl-CoA C-acyltransferase [Chloroflexi bacterium]|nr:acetyl-CoA C-acyltransferase [Chloroflexota bacterium]MBV9596333.1 acetyl-CoA C-acyltransferase [Chloroflexota bacterium]
MSSEAVIAGYVRTPIGRYAGALASVRPDTLAAHVIRVLLERTGVDPRDVEDVIIGCGNQAGEDNRNVARMALLLAGVPVEVPGQTVNRLCGSGLQAVNAAAHAIWSGQGDVFVAGGVESMSRAPVVMLKPEAAYPRGVPPMADSTLGWRFPHPDLEAAGHTDSLGQTAENVAERRGVSRQDQDTFALLSQQKTGRALESGRLAEEIVAVSVPQARGEPVLVERDEHPRPSTTLEALGKLRPAFTRDGTVTAGNSSGLNDGAAALLVTSAERARAFGLEPIARIVSTAAAGVAPDEMGLGPIPASRKVLDRAGMSMEDVEIVEVNEAFASQVIASLEDLGVDWRDEQRVNPNGGAIALGHPLGCSGARLAGTAALQLQRKGAAHALVTMCIGVGQGIAAILEAPDK